MPTMPKEETTALPLSDSNFCKIKLTEFNNTSIVNSSKSVVRNNRFATFIHKPSFEEPNCQIESCNQTPISFTIDDASTQKDQDQLQRKIISSSEHKPTDNETTNDATTTTTVTGNNSHSEHYRYVTSQVSSSHDCSYENNHPNILKSAIATHTTRTVAAMTTPKPTSVLHHKKTPRDYIFGKYIGEGSFSTVYLAVDVNNKREYAIKVCEKRQILREHKQEYIKREREVMHMLTNIPGFVDLSCTFQDARSLYFVMTYARNGDLLPYINKVGSFDVHCTRHYAAELLLACEKMHQNNIIHRDLKPENILLDEDMHTLIADFGSARIITPEERIKINQYLLANSNGNSIRTNCSQGVNTMQQPSSSGCSAYFLSSPSSSTSSSSSSASSMLSSSVTGTGFGGRRHLVPSTTVHTSTQEQTDAGDTSSSTNDTGSSGDDVDSSSSINSLRPYNRKRKGSFVGTAQYVSPEVLQNGPITPSADLWALGCIIYQMMAGLPPFRGSNEFLIFKEIIACNPEFPQGFDEQAEDLVRKLLRLHPAERLGAQDISGRYNSIRSHPFFEGIYFETIRQRPPPQISPYLPDLIRDDDFHVSENLEPGLDKKQLTRLLGLELGYIEDQPSQISRKSEATLTECRKNHLVPSTSSNEHQDCLTNNQQNSTKKLYTPTSSTIKHPYELSAAEKQKRLQLQRNDKWHAFTDNEVILKKGFVNKRKGLFARRRMLLLTTGPRLIYIDPFQMIKKGEIPWSPELRVEAKNFKIFFVHTPNRTYYLDDPEGYSLEWVAAIEKMLQLTFKHTNNNGDDESLSNACKTATIAQSETTRSINEGSGLMNKIHSNRHKNLSNNKQYLGGCVASGNSKSIRINGVATQENELLTEAGSVNDTSIISTNTTSSSLLAAPLPNVIKTASN